MKSTSLAALALMALSSGLQAQTLPAGCGHFEMAWGPFDYRPDHYIPENTYRSHKALLHVVEVEHFTPEVEAGLRGKLVKNPGKDLAYTLAVFPNHHRALVSLSNLAIRLKTTQPVETKYSVDCYFMRGVAFRPDDTLVKLLFANHLVQTGRPAEAEAQIDAAAAQVKDNPFTQRNIAALYLDVGKTDKALTHAHKAQELGLKIDGLVERLQKLGAWRDAAAPVAAAASAP
ncbi:hypothetical protein [Pelomonas sp. SE-A7]|uniref:hypothetical protein n=1 Tax=Pelomonas sp. SE-A7 TaxID=3054953 RepID=UPI00259CED7A|nr:hypothetical protein [Pelomonas sp. SE-A7]MDM4764895.1 hypothetical protein [Pelomonas sp. SE-A7]